MTYHNCNVAYSTTESYRRYGRRRSRRSRRSRSPRWRRRRSPPRRSRRSRSPRWRRRSPSRRRSPRRWRRRSPRRSPSQRRSPSTWFKRAQAAAQAKKESAQRKAQEIAKIKRRRYINLQEKKAAAARAAAARAAAAREAAAREAVARATPTSVPTSVPTVVVPTTESAASKENKIKFFPYNKDKRKYNEIISVAKTKLNNYRQRRDTAATNRYWGSRKTWRRREIQAAKEKLAEWVSDRKRVINSEIEKRAHDETKAQIEQRAKILRKNIKTRTDLIDSDRFPKLFNQKWQGIIQQRLEAHKQELAKLISKTKSGVGFTSTYYSIYKPLRDKYWNIAFRNAQYVTGNTKRVPLTDNIDLHPLVRGWGAPPTRPPGGGAAQVRVYKGTFNKERDTKWKELERIAYQNAHIKATEAGKEVFQTLFRRSIDKQLRIIKYYTGLIKALS